MSRSRLPLHVAAVIALFAFSLTPARAADQWPVPRGASREPNPYKYDPQQWKSVPKEFLEDSAACLLYAGTTNLVEADGTIESITHEITRLNGRKAIEKLGEFRHITYDPSYQKLTLNEARIYKKDGDHYARYLVRMAEMEQSMRIAEQALATLPGGAINVDFEGRAIDPASYVDRGKQGKTDGLLLIPISLSPNLQGQDRGALERVNVRDKRVVLPPKNDAYGSIEGLMNHFMLIMEGYGIRPPAGDAYFSTEGANGELGFYVVSDGGDRPYRVRCRPPCLPPMAALHRMIEGEMVADLIPTFGSVNMIGGELDR